MPGASEMLAISSDDLLGPTETTCRSRAATTLSARSRIGRRALAPVDLSPGLGSFIQLISLRLNISKLNARIMATDLDRSDSNHPSRLTSEPLEALRHLKVSLDNPETSTNDGLDSERCSALHNVIVKHAWQAEGYDLAELPTTTWWHRPDYSPRLDELQKLLPASLVEFLKQALTPPRTSYSTAPGITSSTYPLALLLFHTTPESMHPHWIQVPHALIPSGSAYCQTPIPSEMLQSRWCSLLTSETSGVAKEGKSDDRTFIPGTTFRPKARTVPWMCRIVIEDVHHVSTSSAMMPRQNVAAEDEKNAIGCVGP
jgi:hypothetical protein